MLLVGAIQGGTLLLVSLYAAGRGPVSAEGRTVWLLPSALAMIITTMLVPQIARRIHPPYLIAAGLVITAIGYLVLSRLGGPRGLTTLVTAFVIIMIGVGRPQPSTTT